MHRPKGLRILIILFLLSALPGRSVECVDGDSISTGASGSSSMIGDYPQGEYELPCDTMIVPRNSVIRVGSAASLNFSSRLKNPNKTIRVYGSLLFNGTVGIRKDLSQPTNLDVAQSWNGIRVEPCAEAIFKDATLSNYGIPLEIYSRYVKIENLTVVNAASFLLPDSQSYFLSAPRQAIGNLPLASTVPYFNVAELGAFQKGRGRCKDLEKRIWSRLAESTDPSDQKRVRQNEPILKPLVYYEIISLTVLTTVFGFIYLR